MSYVDVETSAEALKEDEELIEAVNEIVETAATAIYTDIKEEVSGVVFGIREFTQRFFPFILEWREDSSIFWRDMRILALVVVLWFMGFFLVAPSHKWTTDRAKARRGSMLRAGKRSTSLEFLGRMVSPFLKKLETKRESTGDSSSRTRPPLERSRSASSVLGRKRLSRVSFFDRRQEEDEDEDDEEDESEEEKFAKRWPQILETRYARLVLPPTCKRVEKPKHAMRPKIVAEEDSRKKDHSNSSDKHDDENPAQRLMNYMRQFMHLVMSFLKYDYVGAGWTLISWIERWFKNRRKVDALPNDESHHHVVRRLSFGSQASTTSNASVMQGPLAPKSPRPNARRKRDSLIIRSSENTKTIEIVDEGATNATVETPHHSLYGSYPSTCSEGEEKKESPISDLPGITSPLSSPETPPQTPVMRKGTSIENRKNSDSIYETPRLDLRDENLEPGESLASRIAMVPRLSASQNALKSRDMLQNYRTSSCRGGGKSFQNSFNPAVPLPSSPQAISSQKHAPDLPALTSNTDTGTKWQVQTPERHESAGGRFYFETASTQENLKQMAVEVPVPDRNGYIVGDDFLPDMSYTPLLVFVNSRSGPQQGHLLITQLRGLLNPMQVWDLADGGPQEILESFANGLSRLRILVCGGDGTVSWIVSAIESMKLHRWPPIAILPLGTGNDLARVHGWGGGYNNESLIGILEQVSESYVSWLDRWEMTIENGRGKVRQVKSFFNYVGVGADAQTALQVHLLRESRPQLFFSRVVNKAWYGIFGAEDVLKPASINLPHEITLIADGVEVPLPADSQGIILLNIDSYAGGAPLWSTGTKEGGSVDSSPKSSRHNLWKGEAYALKRSRSLDMIKGLQKRKDSLRTAKPRFNREDSSEDLVESLALSEEEKFKRVTACEKPSSCQDGFLDIVSVRGTFHLGQIRVGLSNAQKICQCREATIIVKRKVSVQIDGEPWRQNVSVLKVKRKKDAAIMLHRSPDESNGVETEMANLLEWAEEKDLIDDKVHAALMKEFSRRIETKNRQRREQNNRAGALLRAIGSTGNFGTMGNMQKSVTPTSMMFQ